MTGRALNHKVRITYERRKTCAANAHDTLHAWREHHCRCPLAESAYHDIRRRRNADRNQHRCRPLTHLDWVNIYNGVATLKDFPHPPHRYEIITRLLAEECPATVIAQRMRVSYRTVLRYQRRWRLTRTSKEA